MLLKGRDLAQPLSLAAALCPCWPLGDVCTPSWSAAVSPCRTQQGRPLPGAARPLPWPPGSIKGRPTLSLTRVVLTCLACAVPGTGELGAAGSGRHACHLETASHLDLPLHMSGRHPPPQLSRVSTGRGWQGRGYRQSGRRVRVRVSLPPHLNSHDFLSHSPKPQPHRPGEASYLFSGAGGLASFQQVRFQADCLPLSPFAQSCPTLCDCSPPGSSVHGIL